MLQGLLIYLTFTTSIKHPATRKDFIVQNIQQLFSIRNKKITQKAKVLYFDNTRKSEEIDYKILKSFERLSAAEACLYSISVGSLLL